MTTTLERPTSSHTLGSKVGKAAIYTRVSTNKQEEGASLRVQVEACQLYCEEHDLLVTGQFQDIQSGLDSSRPQYMAVVELARAKGIDKLVVWRLDRLGRDSAEYFPLLKEFRQLGVDVVSVTQPGQSEFMMGMMGIMAEEESRQLSVRVTAAKQRRAKEGKWGGVAPFGYKTEKHPSGGSVLVPNEEAPLVTEMFRRYATGKHALTDLRGFLNERGVLKSRTAVWYIMTNPVYVGVIRHGRHSRSQFHPKAEATQTEGEHAVLIDRDTFDRVQEKLSANKSRQRGGTAPKFLFSGLIYCAGCGHKFVGRRAVGRAGRRWVQYSCNRRTSFGDCKAHSIFETRIGDAVIPPIKALLASLSQEDVRTAVRQELARQQSASDGQAADSIGSLTDKRNKLDARLSRLEDAYLDGDIFKDRYFQKRDEILGQLAEIKEALAIRPRAAMPDLDQLFAIAESIAIETLDDLAWREIIEGMVDRVTVEGDGDGRKNPPVIRVVWKPEYEPLIAMAENVN